jgi:hypothetical protein
LIGLKAVACCRRQRWLSFKARAWLCWKLVIGF